MSRQSFAWSFLIVCAAVGMLVCGNSSAVAANYTWKTLSGTGNWTASVNWSGTDATNLYPGSIGSGTNDAAFIQAAYTSAPTINLDTSVTIRQLNLGGTTGGTTFPVTLSTSNTSTITLGATSGTSIMAVNSAVTSGTNLMTPSILLVSNTLQINMNSVTSGALNLAIAGNVSAGSAGTKIIRYTPNNGSTTTSPSFLDFRGNITNGSGVVSIFYRDDMPNSVNTLKLTGTGNTFTGGLTFTGGKLNQSVLEASPASGTNGALGTGVLTLGSSGSSAILNLGGSPSTVTETALISVAGTGGTRKIVNIGSGHRIMSGTLGVQSVGLTLGCSSSGNLTFANTIQNVGPITISSTGSGKVIFNGAGSTYSGSTTIQAGVLQLGAGSSAGTSTITPLAGGTLSLSPYALTNVAGLAPNAGGLTDASSGFMTVASGLTATDLVTALVAGRNGGTWDGTSGITSSVAAGEVALGAARGVGWLDNGDDTVSFAYAALGDTNLDWQVDVLDAANVLSGGKFNTGDPATWAEGDFNYDGVVDVLDAADFITSGLYNAGVYNPPAPSSLGVAAVPEPAAGVLGVAGLACGLTAVRLLRFTSRRREMKVRTSPTP